MKGNSTKTRKARDTMRAEYDLSGGDRGKYFEAYRRGTNVVLLEPEVAAAFPNSASVNRALTKLIKAKAERGRTVGRR